MRDAPFRWRTRRAQGREEAARLELRHTRRYILPHTYFMFADCLLTVCAGLRLAYVCSNNQQLCYGASQHFSQTSCYGVWLTPVQTVWLQLCFVNCVLSIVFCQLCLSVWLTVWANNTTSYFPRGTSAAHLQLFAKQLSHLLRLCFVNCFLSIVFCQLRIVFDCCYGKLVCLIKHPFVIFGG